MRPRFASVPRGFSLVELLVVISIVGLLAGLSALGIPKAMDAAKKTKEGGFDGHCFGGEGVPAGIWEVSRPGLQNGPSQR